MGPIAILLMLADDYGYNNVGFAHGPLEQGNSEMRTPNLDALAMEGIRLDRHCLSRYCRIHAKRASDTSLMHDTNVTDTCHV